MIEVNIDEEFDRRRWCFRTVIGHGSRRTTIWCQQYALRLDAEVEFYELRDLWTEKTYPREHLVLITKPGPYRDVYGEEAAS